eukprot:gene4517-8973_t
MSSHAVLVIADSPPGMDFGIDCMSYETGPEFRGMTMIPTGLHFLYHSTGMGSRQGFFLCSNKDEIIVRCWDTSNEEISSTLSLPEGAYNNLVSSVREGRLDRNLGPYPISQHHLWVNISGLITERVLTKADISPGTTVYPGDAEDLNHLAGSSRSNRISSHTSNTTALKPYFPAVARIAQFTDITSAECVLKLKLHSSPHHGADALTHYGMDRSLLLEHLLRHAYNNCWEDVLGELQLSFVLFLCLYSYPALQFWKQLLDCICRCESFLLSNPTFTAAFLRVLYEQLNFSPDDFFVDEISQDNFLKPAISSLFHALRGDNLPEPIPESRRRLLNFVRKKFNLFEGVKGVETSSMSADRREGTMAWAADEEELYNVVDEDRPVIVYLSSEPSDGIQNETQSTTGGVAPSRRGVRWASDVTPEVDAEMITTTSSDTDVMRDNNDIRPPMPSNGLPTESNAAWEALQLRQREAMLAVDMDLSLRQGPMNVYELSSHISIVGNDSTASSHMMGAMSPVSVIENGASDTDVAPGVMEVEMTSPEIEDALFSWRYPALHAAIRPELREDFAMTARRILDENESEGKPVDSSFRMLLLEATMFLSEEVPRRAVAMSSS